MLVLVVPIFDFNCLLYIEKIMKFLIFLEDRLLRFRYQTEPMTTDELSFSHLEVI